LDQEPKDKKKRADGQISGLAGEFFVAAELLKREIQTSITLGNAKSIDLFAFNESTGRSFNVQVKTLRKVNYFLIDPKRVITDHVYVFVLLNKPDERVQYFVVQGKKLLDNIESFGKSFNVEKMPGILPKDLVKYENAWSIFLE